MNDSLLDEARISPQSMTDSRYRPDASFVSQRGVGRRRRVLLFLSAALVAVVVLALSVGAVSISPDQSVSILASKMGLPLPVAFQDQQAIVLWAIRLPRILAACLIGAGLGMAGAAMQGLFRNPLADPGLVGVSSGAALGAVLILVLGSSFSFSVGSIGMVPLAAFMGALAVAGAVHHLAQREGRTVVSTQLLAGIALKAICGAGVGLLTYVATDAQLRNVVFWSLGSLGSVTWISVAWLVPLILLPAWGLLAQRRILNALLLGEAEAGHLGFHVERGKRIILICSTLIVGATVSFAGIIAFIGLVVPHLLRLWIGPDHRSLLAGSALLGALLLVIADTVARLVVIPAELPIGIVTALCGAPFFLWLLKREGRRL
jgi:iron complex transport system permease protein